MSELVTSLTTEHPQKLFLTPHEVVTIYSQIEKGIPRSDILQMLSWYNWTNPQEISPDTLERIICYLELGENSETAILSKNGQERTIGQMSRNYEQLNQRLDPLSREKLESIIKDLKDGVTEPPCFVLNQPWEFHNGQIVDGVHRLLAAGIALERGISFRPLTAFVGYDKNPLKTFIRYQKNRLKAQIKGNTASNP